MLITSTCTTPVSQEVKHPDISWVSTEVGLLCQRSLFYFTEIRFFCLMLLTISFAKKRFNNRLPPCWCLSTVTCKEFPHWKSENLKNLRKKVKISLGKKNKSNCYPTRIACTIRTKIPNRCNLVSIRKNVVVYASLVLRIYLYLADFVNIY